VASNTRSSGTAALRYASALVDLAGESGSVAQVEKDVADLRAMIANSPDLQTVLRSPLLKADAQGSALSALADAAKFSPLTKNFLLTVTANRRLSDLDGILKAVQDTLNGRRGQLTAKVETAFDMTSAQKKTLEDTLGKTVGQSVAVEASVNKDLIGGMVVTLGSIQIDDSIKSKLDRLSRAMKYQRDAA